jgi:hypothetical protein
MDIKLLNIAVYALIGFLVGHYWRWAKDELAKLHELTKKPPEPEVGATSASYGRVNEYAGNQDGNIGISEPKTPQMLEWEAKVALENEQHHVQVKPRQ